MSLSSCEDFSSVWSDVLVNSVKIEDDGDATDIMSLLQSLCPVLDLKIDLSLLKIVLNDSPYSKPWGFTPKSSLLHFQNQCYNLTPRSCPWPPTAPSPCSWPSDRSDVPENDHKWLPISEILGLDTKTNSPALFGPIPPLTPQNSSLRH